MSMKLKFLLWAAMSLTFTGVFMSCEDEGVTEEMMEEMIDQKLKEKLEEEKEGKEDEEGKEENDEKGEDEKNEVDSDEIFDILEFVPTSNSTVKVNEIKDRFRTEITIPSTIQVYGKEYKVTSLNRDTAFWENNVKSVKLAEGFTEIPAGLFEDCWKLTSIKIPSSVTSIGNEAFAGCWRLTSIEIPSSVTSIGESAFSYCSGLTSIEIPSSVTSIGEGAFENCENVDIVIDNSEENVTVGRDAFANCKSVTWKR